MLIWLLFFPNAPYIITDLFHLRFISTMPVWYDLVLILSYAWTGLLFGFFSLYRIEKMFFPKLGKSWSVLLVGGLMFLVSFGIYLGRYLRWNSWDVFLNPLPLLGDLADRFLNPMDHPRTWGVTILMGVFLNLVYWSVKALRIRQHHEY